jgi:hypothetical protein
MFAKSEEKAADLFIMAPSFSPYAVLNHKWVCMFHVSRQYDAIVEFFSFSATLENDIFREKQSAYATVLRQSSGTSH